MASDKSNANSREKIGLVKAATFIGGVSLISAVAGFGLTIGRSRKSSPESFDQRNREAVRLALRALGYGTLLSVSGVGIIVYTVKTALGVENAKEFGAKLRNIFPSKDGKFVSYFENWKIPRKTLENDPSETNLVDTSGKGS